MARVLVTGANGFVGRPVVRQLLAAGHEVVAVTAGQSLPADGQGLTWLRADLLDTPQLRTLCEQARASELVHLAWCAKPGGYWTSPDNLAWVAATLQLLEAFRACGGQAAVIAGSCAEYDWRFGLMREGLTPLEPATPYGRSKRSCAQLAELFAELHGLPVAWGRIFQAYGPGEAAGRLLPSVIGALLKGEEARCSHGRQLRDFIHVEDVAGALLHLLAGRQSGAFNIGNGLPHALREAVDHLAHALGRPHLLRYGALAAGPNEPALLVADVERLRSTGWQSRFDLPRGLDDTLAWWQAQV